MEFNPSVFNVSRDIGGVDAVEGFCLAFQKLMRIDQFKYQNTFWANLPLSSRKY